MTDYGFAWGPIKVERLAHIEGRGYSVSVRTDHAEIQVYVSEGGRVVDAYRPGVGKLLEPAFNDQDRIAEAMDDHPWNAERYPKDRPAFDEEGKR